MLKRGNYKTLQKEKILSIIKKYKKEFTVKDIYNQIKDEVGLTTIYRVIDLLVNEDKLKKYIGKDNITYYQYLKECNEENHFYLKCEECGSIIHIDCDCIEELKNHILNKHKFKLDNKQIIINGICNTCINNNKRGESSC